jgi:hypothetical protein
MWIQAHSNEKRLSGNATEDKKTQQVVPKITQKHTTIGVFFFFKELNETKQTRERGGGTKRLFTKEKKNANSHTPRLQTKLLLQRIHR